MSGEYLLFLYNLVANQPKPVPALEPVRQDSLYEGRARQQRAFLRERRKIIPYDR